MIYKIKLREKLGVLSVGIVAALSLVVFTPYQQYMANGISAQAVSSISATRPTAGLSTDKKYLIISWINRYSNISSNTIERSTNKITWNKLATIGGKEIKYEDKTVVPGVVYYYRITTKLLPRGVTTSEVSKGYTVKVQQAQKKDILAILVDFKDAKHDVASDTKTSVMGKLITDRYSVSNIWKENSFGKVNLVTADVTDWLTINDDLRVNEGKPETFTDDIDSWMTQAETAATKAGYIISNYKYIVVISPANVRECGYNGYCRSVINLDQTFRNRIFINGVQSSFVYAHEFGHAIEPASNHAGYVYCGNLGKDIIANPSKCVHKEYDATLMGALDAAHMLTTQKISKGYIDFTTQITVVKKTGLYKIAPVEVLVTKYPRGLRVDSPSGSYWYYVEYRQPIGLDDVARQVKVDPNAKATLGRYGGTWITAADPGLFVSPTMIRIMFGPKGKETKAMSDGQTFTDDIQANRHLRIIQVGHNGEYATICVEFGNESCYPQPPAPIKKVSITVTGEGNLIGDASVKLYNDDTGVVTTTSTIGGVATILIPSGQSFTVTANKSGWQEGSTGYIPSGAVHDYIDIDLIRDYQGSGSGS